MNPQPQTPQQASPQPSTPAPPPLGETQFSVGPALMRSAPRRLRSEDLLGADGVVLIEHAGGVYRLQSTRLGKLILTK